METINNLVTAAGLLDLQGDGYRCELIRGEVVKMSPTGGKHGVVAHRIGRLLGNWAEQQGIGLVFAAETGFKLTTNPDTVRAADVALVLNQRIPTTGIPDSFWEGAPDLAVEVLSPNDSATTCWTRCAIISRLVPSKCGSQTPKTAPFPCTGHYRMYRC